MCSPAHLISNISITILHACVKNCDENAFMDPMWTHWMFHLRFATHFGIALHRCDLGSSRAKLTDFRMCLGSHLSVQIYLICFSCFQMIRCLIECVHRGLRVVGGATWVSCTCPTCNVCHTCPASHTYHI